MTEAEEKLVTLYQARKYPTVKYKKINGFTLCQQNGQRTYGGPPPNWGSRPPPSRDCEVFIGRLPRMCFEDELIPLFLTAGELYEFRLMLDFSGTNRGYGYAHYATPEGAAKAIEKLNRYEIRPGHQIGVLKSKNNCRLLFGNISANLNFEGFNTFIRGATDQVLNVLMFKSFQQLKATDFSISTEMEEAFLGRVSFNNRQNQFAIVEYENHKAAAVARRVLIPKYGHILAIDWAVPPRDRKRISIAKQIMPAMETPLPNAVLRESKVISTVPKVFPVPMLLVQSSPFDYVPFMSKYFQSVYKFFKYLLSICLYKCVDQHEIPLFICKEIEKKIVDRITNVENCSQGVQLIFNCLFWYNESRQRLVNPAIQKFLEEVKGLSDMFINYITQRLNQGPSTDPDEDNYYINVLPVHLNVLFRIMLRCSCDHQARLTEGLGKSLQWLVSVIERGDQRAKDFISEIFTLIDKEDAAALDKASSLAKTLFLNAVTSKPHSPTFPDKLLGNNVAGRAITFKEGDFKVFEGSNRSNGTVIGNETLTSGINIDLQSIKISSEQCKPLPCPQQDISTSSNTYPSVPLLLHHPSIMHNIPFMPKIFNNVLIYFRYILRVCINLSSWHLNIPLQICKEIERKIIDRIAHMENCSDGIQLILTYLSWWIEKNPSKFSAEVQELLKDVKTYSDSFISFTWKETHSGCITLPEEEDYFCDVLPLRLNILFQLTLLFNADSSMKFVIQITKGLNWLDELLRRGDFTSKEFIDELTAFIHEPTETHYEKVKCLGKNFCSELVNFTGENSLQGIIFPSIAELWFLMRPQSRSPSISSGSSASTTKSHNTIRSTEFEV